MICGTIEIYTTHTDGKQRFAGLTVSGVPRAIALYGDETAVEFQPALGTLVEDDEDTDTIGND